MARPNERTVEYAFLLKWLAAIYPGTLLDVGSGQKVLPALIANCGVKVRAIDKAVVKNKYFDKVEKLDISQKVVDGKFDFISCISTLEHVTDYDSAVRNMVSMLNPNGHLCMTFPYNEETYIENVYKLEGSGYGQGAEFHCRVYCHDNIAQWAEDNKLQLIDQELWQVFTGEYWTFGERLIPPKPVWSIQLHHLTCVLYRLDSDR